MTDNVNHPAHYQGKGLEVIQVIEAFDLDFCRANAVKYILRAGKKSPDPKEDLKKAVWYLQRAAGAGAPAPVAPAPATKPTATHGVAVTTSILRLDPDDAPRCPKHNIPMGQTGTWRYGIEATCTRKDCFESVQVDLRRKVCATCSKPKRLVSFYIGRGRDGHQASCRQCVDAKQAGEAQARGAPHPPAQKRCSHCGQMKLLRTDFYTSGGKPYSQCKTCHRAAVKKYYTAKRRGAAT